MKMIVAAKRGLWATPDPINPYFWHKHRRRRTRRIRAIDRDAIVRK